jgi:hypothetical protein
VDKVALVRAALQEVGEQPAADLAALIREKHGVEITPPMVAIVKATLLHRNLLAKYRQEAKEVVEKAKLT